MESFVNTLTTEQKAAFLELLQADKKQPEIKEPEIKEPDVHTLLFDLEKELNGADCPETVSNIALWLARKDIDEVFIIYKEQKKIVLLETGLNSTITGLKNWIKAFEMITANHFRGHKPGCFPRIYIVTEKQRLNIEFKQFPETFFAELDQELNSGKPPGKIEGGLRKKK